MDKSHDEAVARSVHVRVDKQGYERCKGDRTAVLYGLELDERKRERTGYANPCESDAFCIVAMVARAVKKTDDGDDGKQQNDCADGNPFDDLRLFVANCQE